jgi:hypothetical protein
MHDVVALWAHTILLREAVGATASSAAMRPAAILGDRQITLNRNKAVSSSISSY